MSEGAAPSSKGTRTLRFKVRAGLDTPFTRLAVAYIEVGVIADVSGYATLVEVVRRGESAGQAARVTWHVNPSKRQIVPLQQAQAEQLMRESSFRAGYARSKLLIRGRTVSLIEFEEPIDIGALVLIEARVGERVEPPAWAAEDVTHDASTEIMQIVLNASRLARRD